MFLMYVLNVDARPTRGEKNSDGKVFWSGNEVIYSFQLGLFLSLQSINLYTLSRSIRYSLTKLAYIGAGSVSMLILVKLEITIGYVFSLLIQDKDSLFL